MSDPNREPSAREQLRQKIRAEEDRKIRASRTADRSVWFGLGMFGLVGWSVAIPAVVGAASGVWLDRRFPGRISWTLTLLIGGVVIGCLHAWRWLRSESEGP